VRRHRQEGLSSRRSYHRPPRQHLEAAGAPLFHYTVGDRLQSILAAREIRPATELVPDEERPAVWLTQSGRWEPTCNKGWVDKSGRRRSLDMLETHRLAGGLWRIEVGPERISIATVDDFTRLSGIRKREWRALVKVAKRVGSDVSLWRISFEPVPVEAWMAIERWVQQGDAWERVP
jgi:hypothetical protein